MKKVICLLPFLLMATFLLAGTKDSLFHYPLADSIRAVSFIVSVKVQELNGNQKGMTGIQTSQVSLSMKVNRKQRTVVFKIPMEAKILATGLDVKNTGENELIWNHDWNYQETYKLFITTAADSVGNFILYSGYIYFPGIDKWKLIGTCKINGYNNTIKEPLSFFTTGKKNATSPLITEAWCQRNNGSWKKLLQDSSTVPLILPVSNIDSARQAGIDQKFIEKAIVSGKTDAVNKKDGLYYTLIKEGMGRQVSVKDSVTIFYKGYLFSDGTVFDETKDIPRTFMLNRLIRGWQLGLSMCKVGGKIKLVIPSGLGYSIRTRAAKIPPNSILVFDIEVVDAK